MNRNNRLLGSELKVQIITISLLFLFCMGCESGENTSDKTRSVKPNPITASPELIEKIKATGWLESQYTCTRMSMTKQDYKECIRVDAALLPPLNLSKREHFSQIYDPKKYFDCRVNSESGNASCNKYKLRRNEPEPVWPYSDVPPIKWPEAPEEQAYKKGMSSGEYFKALCEAEAGKFIYRTAENVEGVYQIRPLKNHQGNHVLQDKYVFESPYQQAIDNPLDPGFNLLNPGEYEFVETVIYEPRPKRTLKRSYTPSFLESAPDGTKYIRYEGEAYKDYKSVEKIYVSELKSQYGYVWRGIKRHHDREHAIAGNELAIVDLKTNEILGLWRGFVQSGSSKSKKVWWISGAACPKIYGEKDMLDKFMLQVLKPKKDKVTNHGGTE